MSGAQPGRIVVKVGTSTLTDSQGRIDRGFIADLTAQLAAQRALGGNVLLVTSGAIRAGRERVSGNAGFGFWMSGGGENPASEDATSTPNTQNLTPKTQNPKPKTYPDTLPYKQAAAAIGQGLLVHTYTEAFGWRGVDCAQILLTRDDLSDRRRFLNARNTLLALLTLGVVPIINENDTVAVDEIKFGDNDMLAALVATLVEADLLLILSDVEGLYEAPPEKQGVGCRVSGVGEASGESQVAEGTASAETLHPTPYTLHPPIIRTVPRIDAAIEALAGGSGSGVGTGGMRTKVEAARIATEAGIRTVIARGRRERVIAAVVAGELVGTTFLPRTDSERLPARKRWIAYSARPRGSVTVNVRAKEKLRENGVSLLAAGIVEVNGAFLSGDLIEVHDEAGQTFARGLTNYPAGEVRRVKGLRSEQFEEALGYRGFEEIIHRDNLVVDTL